MKRGAWNKIEWPEENLQYLRDHWKTKTNRELAEGLGLNLTTVRTKLYELGLKRMELQYWTEEQTTYLRNHYKTIGDVELAEIFNQKWYKEKGWTKKHIEKKRLYLKLKRTKSQLKKIHARNKKAGRLAICVKKRWETTGSNPIGTIVVWNHPFGQLQHIKTAEGYIPYHRYIWEQEHGKIPKGYNVCFKDGNRMNCTLDNLIFLSDKELHLVSNVLPELRETKFLIHKINQKINNK